MRLPKIPHSVQDMSHNFKTSTKFGLLTPIGIEEVAPADKTRKYQACAYMRLSPLQYPIMHQVHARIHTFEVPFRIILGDDNYQDWLNSKFDLPDIVIYRAVDSLPKYDIFTTLGYPRRPQSGTPQTNPLYVLNNGLDYLACLVIWRDWFADSVINDAQIRVIDNIIKGYQDVVKQRGTLYGLQYNQVLTDLYCAMPKDYFTAARPEPQYGDPVNLTGSPSIFRGQEGEGSPSGPIMATGTGEGDTAYLVDDLSNPLSLDLTIRELWRREQIQRYWDTTNTFGSRTREWLAGHMGVIFPDDRLMIARLLNTVDRVFNVQEVLQTSAGTEDSPLGAYAGKGTLAFAGKRFSRFYVEHGLVISLLSVIPQTGYANSRPRYQFKKNVFDFLVPEFNNIGYQEIYKGELFGASEDPKGVFGYVPRFSEYRYHPNRCSNAFSDDETLLSFHMDRKFDTDPGLNPAFISGNQDQFYRIFSDEAADMDSILVDAAIVHSMWRPVTYEPKSMHL